MPCFPWLTIPFQVKTDQLTKELQMIENTILDRESEIIFNHSAADDNTFVDHGSYVDQGMMQVHWYIPGLVTNSILFCCLFKSRITVKKCVFHKRTIKVCVS